MSSRAREWTADHLPWITIALIALWLPPVIVTLAAGAGVVPSTGFPRLSDPSAFLPAIELALMIGALPLLLRRRSVGWKLLLYSRVAVLLQTAWTVARSSRLVGISATLMTQAIVEAIVGLIVAFAVLASIRQQYR